MIAFCMKKGALQNVNMLTVSKSGRSYIPGKPLSSDLRHLIIDKIVEGGGDPLTMIFPGRFVDIANELNVSSATVSKIWKNYCETGSLSPLKHRGGNLSRLLLGCQYGKPSRNLGWYFFFLFRVNKSLACHSPAKWCLCA